MHAAVRAALVLLPLLALSGCASTGVVTAATGSAASSYASPLAPPPSSATAGADTGAAGRVVQCAGPVVGETRMAPYDGEDTGSSPETALAAAKRWGRWDGAQEGFVLARTETSRRLYVLEVGGVAKQALIVRHGPALKGDGTRTTVTRWWLESWARCDYSELPEAVARQQGLELWTGPDGRPAATSAITSFEFGDGCFPGMRALDIDGPVRGSDEKGPVPVEYLQSPAEELRGEYFDRDYLQHVVVPADAIDSGFERDGAHLWFSKDRRYAYVGRSGDAQAWPRAEQLVRCA